MKTISHPAANTPQATRLELFTNCVLVIIAGKRPKFVSFKNIPDTVLMHLEQAKYGLSWERIQSMAEALAEYNNYLKFKALATMEGWSFEMLDIGYCINGVNTFAQFSLRFIDELKAKFNKTTVVRKNTIKRRKKPVGFGKQAVLF